MRTARRRYRPSKTVIAASLVPALNQAISADVPAEVILPVADERQPLPDVETPRQQVSAIRRRVPKDSLTWTTINYTLNQWDLLVGYCQDGRLHISNALAENAIRPFAVGRRNWLLADTPRGARASATDYSLIETVKANGLEPYDYLCYVLQHIAAADNV